MALLFIDDFNSTTATGGTRVLDAQHDSATDGTGPAAPTDLGNMFYRTTQGAVDLALGINVAFTGFTGSFWRAEDVEDAGAGGVNPNLGMIDWTGINIAGSTGLTVSGLFGGRATFTGSNWNFETTDFITISAQIDGGAYVNILSFRGTGVGNTAMQQDSNLDGAITGADNGMTLTEALANFTANISGTGTTLNLRLLTNVGASEEIAFDDIQVNDAAPTGPINGTPMNDVLEGTSGDDEINGLAGNDTLAGFEGIDTINGDAGNDRLFGGDDNDILNGGDNNDQLWGGTGADAMDGGAGIDGVYYIDAASGVTLNTFAGGTVGDAAGDTYTNIERFFGSNFADNLTGAAGNDYLAGLGGNDIINGAGGNDILVGGLGVDTINGGDDNDVILGSQGGDLLNGDGGNDTLRGGADNDMLNGGNDNDSLDGGSGSDALDGGAGVDRAIYVSATAGVEASLASGGTVGDAAGDTYNNIENLYGSFHADVLEGDANANLMVGLAGNDEINGLGGNDRLIGSAGDDRLDGGDGNDILIGQADADTFVFNGISSVGELDRIIDFEDGVDIIELNTFGFVDNFGDLILTQVGNHVRVEEDTDATGSSNDAAILVYNTMVADLTMDDFMIISPPVQEPLDVDLVKTAPSQEAAFAAIESPLEVVSFFDSEWQIDAAIPYYTPDIDVFL